MLAALQLGGCTRGINPPPPGGVYRSNSAGASFDQSVNIKDMPGEYIAQFHLGDIFRTPSAPGIVYIAAGEQGIIASHDDGATWEVITTPLTFATDVVALENGVIIAAGTDGQGQGFVVRSLDEGKSWNSVFTVPVPVENKGVQLVGGSDVSPSVVLSIGVDPFNADRIYGASSLGTLFVSEQSGKTWRTLYAIQPDSPIQTTPGNQTGIKRLAVSPHTAGELAVITNDNRLLIIREGTQQEITVPTYIATPPPAFGANQDQDVFDIAYIPGFPEALFVGVENGAVITRDRGESWVELPVPIESTKIFNTIRVATSPTNVNRMFVAVNEVMYRSEDGGVSWNTFSLGLPQHSITDFSINPANASRVLIVTQPLSS